MPFKKNETMKLFPMFLTVDVVPCSIMEVLLYLATILFLTGMQREQLSFVRGKLSYHLHFLQG